jgi:hypothetical protein
MGRVYTSRPGLTAEFPHILNHLFIPVVEPHPSTGAHCEGAIHHSYQFMPNSCTTIAHYRDYQEDIVFHSSTCANSHDSPSPSSTPCPCYIHPRAPAASRCLSFTFSRAPFPRLALSVRLSRTCIDMEWTAPVSRFTPESISNMTCIMRLLLHAPWQFMLCASSHSAFPCFACHHSVCSRAITATFDQVHSVAKYCLNDHHYCHLDRIS